MVDDGSPYLGTDWLDGYRMTRVVESLKARDDWTRAAMAELQLDRRSLPWRELRETLLGVPAGDDDAALALELLRGWDGDVAPGSSAAAVYELALEEPIERTVSAKAPNSARWARGAGPDPLRAETDLVLRRTGHLVKLLREQPPGWLLNLWGADGVVMERGRWEARPSSAPPPPLWA